MSPLNQNPGKLLSALLVLCLLVPACKKDADPDPTPTSEIEYYFYGSVDGADVVFELKPLGDIEVGNGLSANNNPPDECDVDYSGFIGAYDGYPFFEVEFVNYYIGPCGETNEDFHSLFPPGMYPYFIESPVEGFGVQVKYAGVDEVVYRSSLGDQTGSDFELTASFEADNLFGKYQRIKGKLNCMLYAENGDSIELKDASFSLSLVSFF
ncbi:MAG: hypothetical protein KDC34_11010 [Saprospiraceae bacterium]|nr:hypothetical protein [Saprospiraceae bacterium]